MAERDGWAARYRDFSEMPDDKRRALANALAAIGRGEKLKSVIAGLRAARTQGSE
jgi:hypothetical protein